MVKRVVIALLAPVSWAPPGASAERWRKALAEDVVDLVASLAAADGAIAIGPDDVSLAADIAWPGMPVYGAERPRAALATALRQRGIPDDVATVVLDRFVEVGLIDDEAYAAAFVAAKHRDRALGVTALRTELRRKGLDEITVDAAVQAVDSDAERDRARALISRRVDAAMSNGLPAARRRLVGLLARRGYSAEMSGQVVDEALAHYGAEQDTGWND